jgi:hypothetical protein
MLGAVFPHSVQAKRSADACSLAPGVLAVESGREPARTIERA